ncbi:MAG: hypothetical protein Q8M16_09975 [Pirellulaceae bacterium]|nr:hypothetical protein [Pirellulaceae bacterium]
MLFASVAFVAFYPSLHFVKSWSLDQWIRRGSSLNRNALQVEPGDSIASILGLIGRPTQILSVDELVGASRTQRFEFSKSIEPLVNESDPYLRPVLRNGQVDHNEVTIRNLQDVKLKNSIPNESFNAWMLIYGVANVPGRSPQLSIQPSDVRHDDVVYVFDDGRFGLNSNSCVWIILVRNDKVVSNLGFRIPELLGMQKNGR